MGHPYYTAGLFECVTNLPPVVGCEAAYLFPTNIDVCRSEKTNDSGGFSGTEHGDQASGVRIEWRENKEGGVKGEGDATAGLGGEQGVELARDKKPGVGHENGEWGDESETEWEGEEVGTAGNLVMHVRSGDVFVTPAHTAYGQVRATS